MPQIKYKPRGSEDQPSPFDGEVLLIVPGFKARIEMIRTVKTDVVVTPDGVVAVDVKPPGSDFDKTAETVNKMYDIAVKHIIAVDLTHKPSGLKFTSFEEMEYLEDFVALMKEIATVVMNGVGPGNA